MFLAADAGAQEMTEQLRQLLAERDAIIAELQARVSRLERQVDGEAPPPGQVVAAAPAVAPPSETRAAEPAVPPTRPPGEFDVDPEAAERALERTLVISGDLLLPPGKIDLEPSITYVHRDTDGDAAPIDFLADPVVAETIRSRRNEVTAALDARIGLPFDSQLELRLPFEYAEEQIDVAEFSDEERGFGVGDLAVGVAKTLVRETGPVPDLIGRVRWDSNFGRDSDGPLTLNDDSHEVTGSVSALKRLDPLAVTARTSYQVAFENDDFNPGNRFGLGAAASLAVSPATSLRLGVDVGFREEDEFEGNTIPGSEENTAILSFGVASIVGRRTLLNVNVGAGLTEDSPDYFIGASLPVRLDAPW